MPNRYIDKLRDGYFIPPRPEQEAIALAKAQNQEEWKFWQITCNSLVPNVGDVHPPDFRTSASKYGGTFLLKLAESKVYFVEVEDRDWHPVESGEIDDDGKVTKEVVGANEIHTKIIDIESGTQYQATNFYPDGDIAGPAYALSAAIDDRESFHNPGHYWSFLLRDLTEITGDVIERPAIQK